MLLFKEQKMFFLGFQILFIKKDKEYLEDLIIKTDMLANEIHRLENFLKNIKK